MSGVINKVKAKVEDVLHKDNTTTGTHTSGTHTTGTHNTGTHTHGDSTGPHNSHLANKADPRVDTDLPGGHGNTRSTGGYGGSDPTGPHNSHLANKADPRVDSDQLGGHGNARSAGGPGYSGSDPTGPHDSRLLNKLDPRVDSDNVGDYGNTAGARQTGHSGGLTGNTHTGHTGGLTGNTRSDPTGPHDSHLANKLDPRVDSDRVGGHGNTASAGGAQTAHGMSGGLTGNTHSDPTGPHNSHLANKLDPRVDSDHAGGYGNTASAGGAHTGHGLATGTTGTHGTHGTHGHHTGATGTAGPHNSNLLNKADPRVDSDLDGSKTYGGNKTHGI